LKKTQPEIKNNKTSNVCWFVSWLVLVILSLDFFNWGRTPRILLGLPGWLWWDIGVVLVIALVFGLLSRFAWGEE